ncbi:MAG: AmmeMemoRadiSam system radical SAM enzyme [Planctomycetes bacterium]|nr:AmmeMemoRadiSam system radical SAM enzyme [Planctomycetota bacterium]
MHPEPHKADFWKPADGQAVDCFLCAHRCRIQPDGRGVCRVRENRGGTLVTLVYGRVIARHVDPIEKKPLFHFLPGSTAYSIATVGCNFQCGFCQNWQISQWPRSGAGEMPGETLDPADIVADARRHGCASISYTYTEPTIFFEYARDVAVLARDAGLKNTFVTNGYMTAEALEEAAGWLDAANVDLKAWRDEFYRKVCKARLEPVKETIRRMHERGIAVEVTTLLVPGRNTGADDLKGIADFLASVSPDLPWHVTRFHPDYQDHETPPTPADVIEQAIAIGRGAGLRYVYAGNIAGSQDTVCPSCGAAVIERRGMGVSRTRLRAGACGACEAQLPIVVA